MKADRIAEMLGEIDSDLIEEAASAGTVGHSIRPLKKIGFSILAAALVIAVSLSAVMAVSADFRSAVIAFFKLGTSETVAQDGGAAGTGDITIVSSADVEGMVGIDYLKIDSDYEYGGGVIFTYHEEEGYGSGAYFCVKDNQLIPLETKRMETAFSFGGYDWNIRFDYAFIDGGLYVHNLPDSRMPEAEQTEALFGYASAMENGETGKVLLTLPFPHSFLRSYAEYKVELDIGTGKITDFLQGCGLDALPYLVHEISLSDDLSKAVILCYDKSKNYNGYAACYYCDIADKKLTPMEEVIGGPVTEESVYDLRLLDNDTLFYTTGNADGWRIRLKTGKREPVYTGLSRYTDAEGGVQFLGRNYALFIGADRSVSLLDLLTGTRSLIKDFVFTTRTGAELSADRTKIYFTCFNEDDLQIGNLGLLDIAGGKMIMMDREGQEIRSEYDIGWFDNDRVAFNAVDENGGRYLYLYEFRN
ncbi:MAG: hypothetical protein VB086_13295 [Clostridiaceae bacterium]|nr:hypothetical protein [Clostridiaceae bacterium]